LAELQRVAVQCTAKASGFKNWVEVAKRFERRPPNICKNQWNASFNKRKQKQKSRGGQVPAGRDGTALEACEGQGAREQGGKGAAVQGR
jgi:hypothetical protein